MGRKMTEGSISTRGPWRQEDALRREVETHCKDIADYLLDLARDGELEPALGALVDALDDGMRQLDGEARVRAEHVYDTLRRNHIASVERKMVRIGIDPYFWG